MYSVKVNQDRGFPSKLFRTSVPARQACPFETSVPHGGQLPEFTRSTLSCLKAVEITRARRAGHRLIFLTTERVSETLDFREGNSPNESSAPHRIIVQTSFARKIY